jgi:hypothetical protein
VNRRSAGHLQLLLERGSAEWRLHSLAILIPSLAVTVRRLHDIDRTGWWILIGLVPLIGTIVLLVFALLDGTPGSNRYGPRGLRQGGLRFVVRRIHRSAWKGCSANFASTTFSYSDIHKY